MDTPLRSSAAERTRPTAWDGAVALGIVLAAALLFWLLLPRDTGGALTARITLDGTELGVYELSTVEEGTLVAVEGARWPITLELSPWGLCRFRVGGCSGRTAYLSAQPSHRLSGGRRDTKRL